MSKVSFRARALDATKPMPVVRADEIPDLPDFATINRSVPQMPTGMEKEEESEHHLQRALSAQVVYGTAEALVIPIPEVDDIKERYDILYPPDFKQTKQYVHIQAFGMDHEIPDYDMDSEDDEWLSEQSKKMELTPLKFEEMMDRLEKGSGQQVLKLHEAKLLLKEDDDLIIAVYDYWLNKRLRYQQPLIPQVKTEKRDGSTTNNPYVAFRRRTEKMQTRKNRKNDEASYEKMLKLKRDLARAVTLLEMIKRREKSKKEMLQLTIEILDKRYQMGDFNGQMLADAEAERSKNPSFIPPFTFNKHGEIIHGVNGDEAAPTRKKRPYRRRKQTTQQQKQAANASSSHYSEVDVLHPDMDSSEEDGLSQGLSPSDHEDENDPDGMFAFRRKRHCSYFAPLLNHPGNWPWVSPEEGGLGDKKYRYCLMTLPERRRCVGFARRRVGRGGRVIIDRAYSPWDEAVTRLDLLGSSPCGGIMSDYVTYVRERKIPHFRPRTPPPDSDSQRSSRSPSTTPVSLEFNLESFQSHQEQLIQMQREQYEKMHRHETAGLNSSVNLEHSFCSQPTSRFTLDSASAEFAVSAVINTSQLQSANTGATFTTMPPATSSTSITLTTTSPMSVVTTSSSTLLQTMPSLSNGPLPENKTVGLSTSPAANVLQLNFPLALTSASESSTSPLVQSSSSPVILSSSLPVSKVITNNKILPSKNSSILKFSSTPPTLELLKQNHEDANPVSSFTKDKPVPMDVT